MENTHTHRGRMAAYPPEMRRRAVALHAEGLGAKRIARELGIDVSIVKAWLKRYRQHGAASLEPYWRPSTSQDVHRAAAARRAATRSKYAEAVRLYATTRLTYRQIAEQTGVCATGLAGYVQTHCRDLMAWRHAIEARRQAEDARSDGGDGRTRTVRASTVARYAAAIERLRTSEASLREVAAECGVKYTALKGYLQQCHPEVAAERAARRAAAMEQGRRPRSASRAPSGVPEAPVATTPPIPPAAADRPTPTSTPEGSAAQRRAATAEKYRTALARLDAEDCPSLAQVAAEEGLHADVLRSYVQRHAPELARRYGRQTLPGGQRVLARSAEKYAEAVRLYRTTDEPLRAIAGRLGLVYKSLNAYILRNGLRRADPPSPTT